MCQAIANYPTGLLNFMREILKKCKLVKPTIKICNLAIKAQDANIGDICAHKLRQTSILQWSGKIYNKITFISWHHNCLQVPTKLLSQCHDAGKIYQINNTITIC